MIIDNTDKLKYILDFSKPLTYYKFVCLVREKDGESCFKSYSKREIFVRDWLVDSQKYLDEVIGDMKTMCDRVNGRLYCRYDRCDVVKSLFNIQDRISGQLKTIMSTDKENLCNALSVKNFAKLVSSIASMKESVDNSGPKYFMFDIDSKDDKLLITIVNSCYEQYELNKPKLDNLTNINKAIFNHQTLLNINLLPTNNGYHILIDRKFNGKAAMNKIREVLKDKFKENKNIIELKDNDMFLVYSNLRDK